MTWIQTASGVPFDLAQPRWQDVCIEDIAHSLSHLCRYGGHTRAHYSVAQHSVLVAWNLPLELRLQGLLHDATEAYVIDVPRPLKAMLPEYHVIEERAWWAISEAFELPLQLDPEVKRVDEAILDDERRCLMAVPRRDWGLTTPGLGIKITPWPAEHARKVFLDFYYELVAAQ